MKISIDHLGRQYHCDSSEARSLAIDLNFRGPQPNFFGTQVADKKTLQMGDFVASTKRGSGCNVEVLNLIPHCNGTHSETVSHIVDDMVSIGQAANVGQKAGPFIAMMVTVPALAIDQADESYRPALESGDKVITAASLKACFEATEIQQLQPQALIVRTEPNSGKETAKYDSTNQPAFFSIEAIEAINQTGIKHLLVDIPSIDRIHDEGLLTNHHLFWNVAEGTHKVTEATWVDKTITEMIFASDDLPDGLYLLNLQIPGFVNTDAAPSRPIVYPLYE